MAARGVPNRRSEEQRARRHNTAASWELDETPWDQPHALFGGLYHGKQGDYYQYMSVSDILNELDPFKGLKAFYGVKADD